MIGDGDAAVAAARRLFLELGMGDGGAGVAIDLGAGLGHEAIALADLGWQVTAIDSCAALVAAIPPRIRAYHDDLLGFRAHVPSADAVVCMGDTLTHLPSLAALAALLDEIATALRPGGRFVATLRDYTRELTGTERFIPVKSDTRRILTCFLEYAPDHVTVHDILHERDEEDVWAMNVSAYAKLRLARDGLAGELAARGLEVEVNRFERGWIVLCARRR
jgi:SAM-dependent methyltransferase